MTNRMASLRLATLLALAVTISTTAQASGAREIPSVTGPIAGNSPANHAFDAAAYQAVPIDLGSRGYREDEYFLSGTANVYQYEDAADPSDTTVTVLRRGPYTNRILVRRPTDPGRFSGNVIVELLNATNNYDLPVLWSYDHDYFLSRGDIWIGITSKPVTIAGLKTFNPVRYAPLSWDNPNKDETAATCPVLQTVVGGASHATEDGLLWDVLSQTGALVRSHDASNPLQQYRVRAVYAAGYSQSAIDLVAYIDAITPGISGAPPFDGYLVGSGFGIQAPLDQCSPAPLAGDPRNVLRSRNAAIIATQSQTDYRDGRVAYRNDSDAADDRFRLYEAAGPSHVVVEQTTSAANATDTHAAGGTTLVEDYATCQAGAMLSTFPGRYLLDASFAFLESWVTQGRIPPHASLIQSTGTAPALITLLDQNGNGLGGVRAPELDVPVATYTESTGASSLNCGLSGQVIAFDKAKLQALYPSRVDYLAPFVGDTLSIARPGFLTPDDAAEAISAAAARSIR
ncbi:alpha/beta hydrolase domain-containing protein [Lichenicoccus sp.]|uniref:alpha/beta hydrolase domain-containing protein n=1 Tax=Lichenicoccus sp. TaxID=2781899 RepID=UPI003D12097F